MSRKFFFQLREILIAFSGRGTLAARWRLAGRWILLAGLIAATVFLVSPYFFVEPVRFTLGATLQRPVISEIRFFYNDPDELLEWERMRNRQFKRVYRFDTRVQNQAALRLRALFDESRAFPPVEEEPLTTYTLQLFAARLRAAEVTPGEPLGFVFSDTTLATLLYYRFSPSFADDLGHLMNLIYHQGVIANAAKFRSDRDRLQWVFDSGRPPELPNAEQVVDYPYGIERQIRRLAAGCFEGLPERGAANPRAAAIEILLQLIRPNIVFDEKLSLEEREKFTEGLASVRRQVTAGDALLAAGQTITEREADLLKQYNEALRRYLNLRLIGDIGFALLVTAILCFYMLKFRANFRFDAQTLLFTGLPLLVTLGLERLLLVITSETDVSLPLAGFAFPAGALGMLGVLLLDVRMALLLVTWGSLFFGFQANLNFQFVVVALLGGYTAVGALTSLRQRRELVVAGLRIAIVNALGILTLLFIDNPGQFLQRPTGGPLRLASIGVINGLVCPMIVLAALPLFELLFGVVTDIRLLELTGLDHPLTRRMEQEAPGTWQHTLNVTKLAEAAAQAIGVNYLLVRAGAFFHDIGKLRKPLYFTENQASAEDKRRHQELRPQLSVLIIRDHVKSGMEMAREAGLPRKIIDFIPEHHGTSLIKYFYYKAKKQAEEGKTKEPAREEDYRYPGPKPQSRETAIVMLADAVEATATAKLTGAQVREDEVRRVVHETILDKFNDGQFDECDLTLADLQRIREAFLAHLLSRFHSRIDYPKMQDHRA